MSLGAKYASTWKRSVNDVDYIIQIHFMTCLINLFLQLAKQHSGVYVDTSAKTKENIHKVKKKKGVVRKVFDWYFRLYWLAILGGLLREFRLLWYTIGAHNISTVISFLKL